MKSSSHIILILVLALMITNLTACESNSRSGQRQAKSITVDSLLWRAHKYDSATVKKSYRTELIKVSAGFRALDTVWVNNNFYILKEQVSKELNGPTL